MKARVFNIQKYSIYDGPGIRTLVFFQGCPLRCLWCSNPEGKAPRKRLMWRGSLCAHCGICAASCPAGNHALAGSPPRHVFSQNNCALCGKCVEACPQDALNICGDAMSIADIMDIVRQDEVFYNVSGGGLTIGGGEPLAQPEAAIALLAEAKKAGLHTALETCGHARPEDIAKAAPLTDIFLYDIKHLDAERHKELTGQDNRLILQNLAWLLDNGYKVRARMPLINGCNADIAEIENRRDFLLRWQNKANFTGVDLLPYHKLGIHKYEQLGEDYGLDSGAAIAEDFLHAAQAVFFDAGISVAVVRH